MRIPVKAKYKGYTPALDPFSKEKLVWFKPKPQGNGIPTNLLITAVPIIAARGAFWSFNRKIQADIYDSDFIVYDQLGHNRFISLFVIAAIIGVLGYFWGLFVYDFKKTKKYSKSESIDLYKKAPKYAKEKQERMKQWWWAIPAAALMLGGSFLMLFVGGGSFYSGGLLGLLLYTTSLLVYLAIYSFTVFLSRRYLNRKFNTKPKKTK